MQIILDQSERQETNNIVESLKLSTLTQEQKIYVSGVLDGIKLADSVKQIKAS